jgi:ribosomal protein S27E
MPQGKDSRMSEVVSNLYRVTVAIPSGRSWNVLVRAVDAESAIGAIRARGHAVVGVTAGKMPRRVSASPRISCLNCDYVLTKLPVGDAGEVQCPECGVINTPLGGEDSLWSEIKATRAELKRHRQSRPFATRPLTVVGGAVFFTIVILLAVPTLRRLGLLP